MVCSSSDFQKVVCSVKNVGLYRSQSFIDLLLDRCHRCYNKLWLFTKRINMDVDESIVIRQGTNISKATLHLKPGEHIMSAAPS